MLILAGITINLTVGQRGILNQAQNAGKAYNESEIRENVELGLIDIETEAILSNQDLTVEYALEKLQEKGVFEEIDKEEQTGIIGGYVVILGYDENGKVIIEDIEIATNEPRIRKIEIVKTTIDSISIKVTASNVNGGDYKYYIKNTTTNEEYSQEPIVTLKTNEYIFTGLTRENKYKIKVELVNENGNVEKEIVEEIETAPTKVSAITLNKTTLELVKGSEDTTLQAMISPDYAEDKSLTWTSSDEGIVIVEATDSIITITGVKEGTANIIATANDGSGKNAICRVTVTTPPPPEVGVGGTTHTEQQIPYTWEELNSIAKVISDNYGTGEGQINNDTAEVNVSINGKTGILGIGDWTTVNDKQVRILGFNHDTLTDENAYGEGNTNTYAGISFEFAEYLKTASMNSSKTNTGGWGACVLRDTLNSTTYDDLENRAYIKQVVKQYIKTCNNANSVTEAYDKLWLLSCSEIFNNGYQSGSYGDAITKEGEQYKYYKNINALYDSVDSGIIKDSGAFTCDWWLRSPSNRSGVFSRVGVTGSCGAGNATLALGVAPGFCI